jgi:AhpD family alkylhydroperoxidase
MISNQLYPGITKEISEKRTALAPEIAETFRNFSKEVFKDGALPEKTKQLIAVAVAHVTQCPYCIHGHTAQALRKGASEQEIMEAIWVAAEMRAGGSYAHAALAIDEMKSKEKAF